MRLLILGLIGIPILALLWWGVYKIIRNNSGD